MCETIPLIADTIAPLSPGKVRQLNQSYINYYKEMCIYFLLEEEVYFSNTNGEF